MFDFFGAERSTPVAVQTDIGTGDYAAVAKSVAPIRRPATVWPMLLGIGGLGS